MRIACTSWEALYAAPVGGVGIHVSKLAQALSAIDHEIHIFTRIRDGQNLYDNIFGVHYHRCPFERDRELIKEADNFSVSALHYFKEAEHKFGLFDRIHAHDWLGVVAGLKLAGKTGLPTATTFHSTELGRNGSWPNSSESKAVSTFEDAAISISDTVISTSHQVRRELEQLYRPPDWKTSTIYHGIDLSPFDAEIRQPGEIKQELSIDPMAPTILCTGSLTHRKGQDLLIHAMQAILHAYPATKLILVGDGPLRGHLENEANRLGIGHAVIFAGTVKGKKQVELYRSTDVICVPDRTESFGIAALSAWAAEKPVVATESGRASEFIMDGTNGLIAGTSSGGIVEAIVELFSDFDRARWMGRNGRVAAETAFTWKKIADSTAKAFARADELKTTK